MAAWHEQRVDEKGWLREVDASNRRPEWGRKPGLGPHFWLGLVFALYLSAMLGLLGFVVWKVAHPLPHLIP